MLKPKLYAIAHTYGYVVDITMIYSGLYISMKEEKMFLPSIEYLMNVRSQNHKFYLNQSLGLGYDDFVYDEVPHMHC